MQINKRKTLNAKYKMRDGHADRDQMQAKRPRDPVQAVEVLVHIRNACSPA
jgi:hypothetical protein